MSCLRSRRLTPASNGIPLARTHGIDASPQDSAGSAAATVDDTGSGNGNEAEAMLQTGEALLSAAAS